MAKPKNIIRLEGQDQVISNLRKSIAGIRNNTRRGMQEASKFIKKGSQDKTPVEHGEMKRSAFYRTGVAGKLICAVIGYMAQYAPWVHEMPGKLKGVPRPSGIGRHWDPDGEPKFLQNFVVNNVRKIMDILHRFASKRPK